MSKTETELIYKELSYATIGAAIAVHRELGPGLLERMYHSALEVELDERGLAYRSHLPIAVEYRGKHLGFGYQADLVVENKIVLELKSVEKLRPVHTAQTLTYLRLLDLRVAYVLNFNVLNLVKHGCRRLIL